MGYKFPSTGLWCDAPGRVHLTVLTHAGIRTRARRIVATRATSRAAGLERRDVITPVEGVPFDLGKLSVTLVPSGYAPGAVMCLVEMAGGSRILYASRIGSRDCSPGSGIEAPRCDTIVIDPGPDPGHATAPGHASDQAPADIEDWARLVAATGARTVRIPASLAQLRDLVKDPPSRSIRWLLPEAQLDIPT